MLLKLLEGQIFGPVAVAAMVQAYEAACHSIGLTPDEDHRTAGLMAKTIIEACEDGVLDPELLKAKALAALKMQ